MFDASDIAEIERAVQMAITPAFILSGIFAALNVLAARLARIVDRERTIREGGSPALPGEPRRLGLRARWVHRSLSYCVAAAILLCTQIVTSFVGVVLDLQVAFVVAGLLVLAMLALVAALVFFLAEVHMASRHLPRWADE